MSVLKNLLLSVVSNPVRALQEANFIGILAGRSRSHRLRHAGEATRNMVADLAAA